MTFSITRHALLAAPLILSACGASTGSYPPLARHHAERVSGQIQPAPTEITAQPLPPVSEELDAKVARLVADAERAHGIFLEQSAVVTQAISALAESDIPSDEWVDAQLALADLQSLRSKAVISQAALGTLYAQERISFPQEPSPTALAIGEALEKVDEWVNHEDDLITHLSEKLAS